MKKKAKTLSLIFTLFFSLKANAQWPNFKLDASAGIGKFFINDYISDLFSPSELARVKDVCTGGVVDLGFSFFSDKGFGAAFNYSHYVGIGKGPNYADKLTLNSFTFGLCYFRAINESSNYICVSFGLRRGFAVIEVIENGKTESASDDGWKFNFKFGTYFKLYKKLYFNLNLEGASASIFATAGPSLVF